MNKDFFDDYFDEDDETDDEPPKKEKTLTKGFLTALGVCLVAIGAAVWTTVNSVNSYLNPSVAVYDTADTESVDKPPVVSFTENDKLVNAPVNASKSDDTSRAKNDAPVRFNCEPIKNHRIIVPYSETPVYNETLLDYRAHPGLDYEAQIDDKVRAMGAGVVKDIYSDDLLGNVVEIEHSDSVCSYYCGLAKTTLVQKGDVVSAGDFVGTVYAIPGEAAQQAHVHVAVKENGRFVDPRKFMNGSRND